MGRRIISADDFNHPFKDPVKGPREFTEHLKQAIEIAYMEPFAGRIFSTLVELRRNRENLEIENEKLKKRSQNPSLKKVENVTENDIQLICDAIRFAGYDGNNQSTKTIADIRRELEQYHGVFNALHVLRNFNGEGADVIKGLFAKLERNQSLLDANELHALADSREIKKALRDTLLQAARYLSGGPTSSSSAESLGDVPMTNVVSVGKTRLTSVVVGMLKVIGISHGRNSLAPELNALIEKCSTQCNTLDDHLRAMDGFIKTNQSGNTALNAAVLEMYHQMKQDLKPSRVSEFKFDSDKILRCLEGAPSSIAPKKK